MDERLLTNVEINLRKGEIPLPFSELDTLTGVEIWTSRSKIVNEHLSSLNQPLELRGIVNPLYTPLWSIVDKPYNVYTTNENTQMVFQSLLNYSDTEGGVSHSALLTKSTTEEGVHILFYTELHGSSTPCVKCIVLELNISKLLSIIEKDKEETGARDKNRFIDENDKEELMDTLMRQRMEVFNNLSSKRQAEATVQEQQIKMKQTKQFFRKIISKEVKLVMEGKPRPDQNEMAEICYKAMSYRFKQLVEVKDEDRDEIFKWLKLFLEVMGVSQRD